MRGLIPQAEQLTQLGRGGGGAGAGRWGDQ